jgi:transposase-like protein
MSGDRNRRYPALLRERAVRMVVESRSDHVAEWEATRSVASKLGIGTTETVRKWVRSAKAQGETTDICRTNLRLAHSANTAQSPRLRDYPHLRLVMHSGLTGNRRSCTGGHLACGEIWGQLAPFASILPSAFCLAWRYRVASVRPALDIRTYVRYTWDMERSNHNMSLAEMSPIVREPGVHELAVQIGEILEQLGETSGPTLVDTLADKTGSPASDVRLALGRISLDVTVKGTVVVSPTWRSEES